MKARNIFAWGTTYRNMFPANSIGTDYSLLRGDRIKPLFITVAGDALPGAREAIAAMHGQCRVPTLLKKVDHLCRTAPLAS